MDSRSIGDACAAFYVQTMELFFWIIFVRAYGRRRRRMVPSLPSAEMGSGEWGHPVERWNSVAVSSRFGHKAIVVLVIESKKPTYIIYLYIWNICWKWNNIARCLVLLKRLVTIGKAIESIRSGYLWHFITMPQFFPGLSKCLIGASTRLCSRVKWWGYLSSEMGNRWASISLCQFTLRSHG